MGWTASYSPNFSFRNGTGFLLTKKRPQPDFTCLITGAKIGFILVASKLITIGLFYGL